jgi:hypothetical protein
MSNGIEDRLTAALAARAELVTADDLRPLEVPDRPRGPRARVVIALAAAAAAVAIAVPFAIARIGGDHADRGPVGPPPTQPSATQTTEQPEQPTDAGDVIARQRADVDGDGRPDDVRVIVTARRGGGSEGVVEVTLASGETGSASWPVGYPPRLLPAFSINRDDRWQVLLRHTAGGDEAQVLIYSWADGAGLVRARVASQAPLALGLDGQGTYTDYYTDAFGLHSWLRGEPVKPGGWPMFHVQDWVWTLDGDQLTAKPDGDLCIDATAHDPPTSCS